MKRYNPNEIEPKWQKIWQETGVYNADLKSDKPKYIAMSMFNYPSGAGIHIGHAMNYTISDVKARFKRQQGYESYHPVGWDAFGLPAENYAIKAGVSPQESMATIIPSYHKQYKAMGWSNDWSREISTHEPEYYKWTQWIFSEMHKNGLAYRDARMQWWCEKCQTVLANEQVIDGKCWRHEGVDDPQVEKKEVKQWFFKITEYADELLEAIDDLDWTPSVKLAQKNWIGKSIGAEIEFAIVGREETVKVFTTRADTIFGATFLVLSPEHDLVQIITAEDNKSAVEEYLNTTLKKTEVERQASKEKTGVFTGTYAINPINSEKIPIWIADFVIVSYGTGAVFADAHDERDVTFANKYSIPLRETLEAETGIPQENPEFRRSIVAIVRNPANDSYLSINWGTQGGNLFIGGGREENEDTITCAKREIVEETGYKNLKFISQTVRIHHNYYAHSKGKARRIEAFGLLFDLQDETKDEPRLEIDETNKFTVEWLNKREVETNIVDELHSLVFRKLINNETFTGEGILYDSGEYSGLRSSEAREKIVADLILKKAASEKVNFRMRDWSVSRQRYWGAPIPIIHCKKCGPILVPDKDLPVILPELEDFQPSGDGRSALARATDWLNTTCPECGGPAERETDTLDTYICSSWYMYRYFDPNNQEKIFDSELINKWAPIDFYNGGDHATAHLLYARFIARFFSKVGLVDNPEPFKQMFFNGKVTASDGSAFSKSKGNGVDPLEIINSGYGADALRTYLMFAAPLDIGARWDSQGVPGTYRFLSRLWNLVQEFVASKEADIVPDNTKDILRATHTMIKKASDDIQENRYNTAIASMMECLNTLYIHKAKELSKNDTWQQALQSLVACVAPFAPHMADELWYQLGHSSSVHIDSWPIHDDQYIASDIMNIVVQINGKVRAKIDILSGSNEEQVKEIVLADAKVLSYIKNSKVTNAIYVPKKLINIVTST